MQTDKAGNFNVILKCCFPPFFLPAGYHLAQAIMMPNRPPENYSSPEVFWAEIMRKDRPLVDCKLHCQDTNIHLTGMMDTGADVTVISSTDWPLHWELQTLDGLVSGIGGSLPPRRSKDVIQIESPEGRIASIRPFVFDSGFTLWGRDPLSQWGTRMEITTNPRDFQ